MVRPMPDADMASARCESLADCLAPRRTAGAPASKGHILQRHGDH